jgi:hypothetical protein
MSLSSRKFFSELQLRSNDTQKVIDKRSTLWYSLACLFTLTLELSIKISIAPPLFRHVREKPSPQVL